MTRNSKNRETSWARFAGVNLDSLIILLSVDNSGAVFSFSGYRDDVAPTVRTPRRRYRGGFDDATTCATAVSADFDHLSSTIATVRRRQRDVGQDDLTTALEDRRRGPWRRVGLARPTARNA